ncbi:MAG: DUF3343 domain-containing protein [Clostridia bacterium]|nr:DUF3343 domain-containing protein [Clostridia bacterium]
MREYMITLPSVTYALKGRDILRRLGFKARIERKSRQSGTGCGYGIVTEGDIYKAEQALKNASIKILEIADY